MVWTTPCGPSLRIPAEPASRRGLTHPARLPVLIRVHLSSRNRPPRRNHLPGRSRRDQPCGQARAWFLQTWEATCTTRPRCGMISRRLLSHQRRWAKLTRLRSAWKSTGARIPSAISGAVAGV